MAFPLRIALYSPFFGQTVGGGEKYLARTAEAIHDAYPQHAVELIAPAPIARSSYAQMLGVDLSRIAFVSMGRHREPWPSRWLRVAPLYDQMIMSARVGRVSRRYDVFLAMVSTIPAVSEARRGIILCQFPYRTGSASQQRGIGAPLYAMYRLPYRLLAPLLLRNELRSFELVICYSKFVQRWVRQYWNREAKVVYPPIDVAAAEPDWQAKRPSILSVGRFFAGSHTKRHDLMARVFRKLCEEGLRGWDLHLAGSVERNTQDLRYYQDVDQLARGYPVHLHPDVSFDELQRLYREAAIYWHAAGYGVDAEANPERLEHFGMTTAEAMSYGAVPVVLARGGQPEVVRHGIDGFLWTATDELKARTTELVVDPDLRERMGRQARASAFRFSVEEFNRSMLAALDPILRDLERPGVSPPAPP
jgi:glycosyltransferase involved in cell wall biosynthesis